MREVKVCETAAGCERCVWLRLDDPMSEAQGQVKLLQLLQNLDCCKELQHCVTIFDVSSIHCT